MTNEQRYIHLCQYFDRLVNEIEMEELWWRNKSMLGRIPHSDLYLKLAELEIKKKTIEELSKNVLQYMKVDIP